MMAASARSAQIMRDRRAILATLGMIYPRWMVGEELYHIILDGNPEYDRRTLVKDMNYLNEKGYAAFKGNAGIDVHSISVKNCMFKLTADGTDVANEIVRDPTLEV